MFDFFKNKAIAVITDELDGCLGYVSEVGSKSGTDVDQILNTIHHFIQEIANGRLTEGQAQKHFMNMKTDIAFKKNLSSYRDLDYSKSYILNAFFTSVASNRLNESKAVGRKILNYCADNCSRSVENVARQIRDEYTKIFQ